MSCSPLSRCSAPPCSSLRCLFVLVPLFVSDSLTLFLDTFDLDDSFLSRLSVMRAREVDRCFHFPDAKLDGFALFQVIQPALLSALGGSVQTGIPLTGCATRNTRARTALLERINSRGGRDDHRGLPCPSHLVLI